MHTSLHPLRMFLAAERHEMLTRGPLDFGSKELITLHAGIAISTWRWVEKIKKGKDYLYPLCKIFVHPNLCVSDKASLLTVSRRAVILKRCKFICIAMYYLMKQNMTLGLNKEECTTLDYTWRTTNIEYSNLPKTHKLLHKKLEVCLTSLPATC